MRIIALENYDQMSKKAASILASQMILKPESVLGLATGATPIGAYEGLVRMYNEETISFLEVKTFNLDEYYGLDKSNNQSYYYFMQKHLFKHVNIKEENVHIPDGRAKDVDYECHEYEESIKKAGGIDIQLLGVGRNGHIGFNEPDVKFEAVTHLVTLDEDTVDANSRFFNNIEEVPRKAISMGIKTIMNSKKILLLASGEEKAEIVYQMVYGKITPEIPVTVLQLHPDVTILLDKAAAKQIEGDIIRNF